MVEQTDQRCRGQGQRPVVRQRRRDVEPADRLVPACSSPVTHTSPPTSNQVVTTAGGCSVTSRPSTQNEGGSAPSDSRPAAARQTPVPHPHPPRHRPGGQTQRHPRQRTIGDHQMVQRHAVPLTQHHAAAQRRLVGPVRNRRPAAVLDGPHRPELIAVVWDRFDVEDRPSSRQLLNQPRFGDMAHVVVGQPRLEEVGHQPVRHRHRDSTTRVGRQQRGVLERLGQVRAVRCRRSRTSSRGRRRGPRGDRECARRRPATGPPTRRTPTGRTWRHARAPRGDQRNLVTWWSGSLAETTAGLRRHDDRDPDLVGRRGGVRTCTVSPAGRYPEGRQRSATPARPNPS
jgi:hypothetical protein